MAIVNGWFAYMVDQATLISNVPGESADGWIVEGTLKRLNATDLRWLTGTSPTTRINVGSDGGKVDWVVGNSNDSSWVLTHARYDSPCYVKITGEAGQRRAFTQGTYSNGGVSELADDGLSGSSNNRFTIAALNGTVGNDIDMSHAKITDSSGTVVAEWDGNYVLNASGDGFVTRTAANADPAIAESGFNLKFYDISGNGHHADLPANTTWEFVSSVVLPSDVFSGDRNVAFTAPDGFNVTSLTLGGISLPFTFDAGTGQGRFDAPALDGTSPFPLFGDSVQLQLTDSSNGNTAESNVNWQPAAPYVGQLLTSDPDVSSVNNAYYQWPDPPVAGNMAVFNQDLYNIGANGKLTIEPDAPASFAVNEYIIANGGIQEFERNSSSAAVVGETPQMTLNGLSTVTMTEGDSYTDQGANWTDAEDGSGTVYSSLIINESTAPGTYTQPYSHTDADGNTVSRNRTIIVEPAQVPTDSTLNVTITGIPDGSYETYVNSPDVSGHLFGGNKSWSGGSATFTISQPAGTNCSVSVFGATEGGLVRGVTV